MASLGPINRIRQRIMSDRSAEKPTQPTIKKAIELIKNSFLGRVIETLRGRVSIRRKDRADRKAVSEEKCILGGRDIGPRNKVKELIVRSLGSGIGRSHDKKLDRKEILVQLKVLLKVLDDKYVKAIAVSQAVVRDSKIDSKGRLECWYIKPEIHRAACAETSARGEAKSVMKGLRYIVKHSPDESYSINDLKRLLDQ